MPAHIWQSHYFGIEFYDDFDGSCYVEYTSTLILYDFPDTTCEMGLPPGAICEYLLMVYVRRGVSPGHPLVLYVRWVSRIGRCTPSTPLRAWAGMANDRPLCRRARLAGAGGPTHDPRPLFLPTQRQCISTQIPNAEDKHQTSKRSNDPGQD